MSTITADQQQAISDFLATHELPSGLGTAEKACSVAAINLALSGKLTDSIPDCMSYVIGRWIIRAQDAMPDDMRNSAKWKALLPLAAGTGRNDVDEKRRINLILNWMWETVLPSLQTIADARGFGDKWKRMCEEKTANAANAAANAANAAANAAYAAAANAAYAAAANAAYAAAANAAYADAYADAYAAYANAAEKTSWEQFDPCGLLEQLVSI